MRYLFAGGGTGGHIFPAMAVATRARSIDSDAQILFVGTERGIENRVVRPHGFELRCVNFSGFAGQSLWRKFIVIGRLVSSVCQGLKIVSEFNPDVVIGVGGYASLPLLIAAGLRRIPVVLHEQNAIPGLANKLASRWAGRICISLAQGANGFGNRAVVLTGNPVRQELFNCLPSHETEQLQLLVFGGSQGAAAINSAVLQALPQITAQLPNLRILHQTGEKNHADVVAAYEHLGFSNVEVLPFIDDMASAYANSQLVVCRSGATTVAELSACGRAAVLVPLPQAAADHQTHNAQALVDEEAAVMIAQTDLSEQLAPTIVELMKNPQKIQSMGSRAKRLSAKGAADLILNECRMLVQKRK
ncbi:MAG: undecaprenyldiphospho-muramoylpentapeptide beta-N-acetylglucosaminyltransferase [Desulfobacteraceae bacterium 4572_35.1]|nr:MAG: undecaprenyldiphospho-muramoylpentapeptide beta-N-acetylglucosaminyltransferase [Desulfobacteraceae bacterium 4572_35.1]